MMPDNHCCAPHIWISLSLDHLQFVTYLLSFCAHVCPNYSNIFYMITLYTSSALTCWVWYVKLLKGYRGVVHRITRSLPYLFINLFIFI
jgi:hypothetical protein